MVTESDDASDAAPGPERSGTYTRHRAVRRSLSDAEGWNASAPELEISETEAGRETLGAIAQELRPDTPRHALATEPYGDRISNAPGARAPSRAAGAHAAAPSLRRERDSSAPEITVGQSPLGRDTMAAIAEELAGDVSAPEADDPDATDSTRIRERAAPPRPASARAAAESAPDPPAQSQRRGAISVPSEPLAVYEMATFVVRCDPVHLASNYARRRFVEERLLHRLPVQSMDLVDRVDVTPWTVRDTLIVRVWCIVPPP